MSDGVFDRPAAGPLTQRLVQSQQLQRPQPQPQELARLPDDVDGDDVAPPGADIGRERSADPAPAAPVRWLRVRHETSYRYDSDVEGALHLAHLRPRDTATQQVRVWSLVVSPHPDPGVELASGIRETYDPWGNARQVFAHSQVHDQLDVVSAFEAGVSAQPLPAPGSTWPCPRSSARRRLPA